MGHEKLFVSVPVEKRNGEIKMIENFWEGYSSEKMKELEVCLEELNFEKKLAQHILDQDD